MRGGDSQLALAPVGAKLELPDFSADEQCTPVKEECGCGSLKDKQTGQCVWKGIQANMWKCKCWSKIKPAGGTCIKEKNCRGEWFVDHTGKKQTVSDNEADTQTKSPAWEFNEKTGRWEGGILAEFETQGGPPGGIRFEDIGSPLLQGSPNQWGPGTVFDDQGNVIGMPEAAPLQQYNMKEFQSPPSLDNIFGGYEGEPLPGPAPQDYAPLPGESFWVDSKGNVQKGYALEDALFTSPESPDSPLGLQEDMLTQAFKSGPAAGNTQSPQDSLPPNYSCPDCDMPMQPYAPSSPKQDSFHLPNDTFPNNYSKQEFTESFAPLEDASGNTYMDAPGTTNFQKTLANAMTNIYNFTFGRFFGRAPYIR